MKLQERDELIQEKDEIIEEQEKIIEELSQLEQKNECLETKLKEEHKSNLKYNGNKKKFFFFFFFIFFYYLVQLSKSVQDNTANLRRALAAEGEVQKLQNKINRLSKKKK